MYYLTSIDSNGQILSSISGSSETVHGFRPHVNATVVLQEKPPENTYRDHTTQTWVAMPNKPSKHHTFNWLNKQWEDPRTLQNYKDAQWAKIKQARSNDIASQLVTPYGTFDADAASRTAITDSVLMLQTLSKRGQPKTIDFTLANDQSIALTTSQMEDVGLMLGEKTNIAFGKARQLRTAIDNASTVAQVEAITW